MPLLSPALLFDNLFPNQPTPGEDNSNRQEHIFDGRGSNEVTLGTGMSCISSVCRGEDNGSDNEDNLNDRQQRPNSSSPKCAMREKRNPDGLTSTFSIPIEKVQREYDAARPR